VAPLLALPLAGLFELNRQLYLYDTDSIENDPYNSFLVSRVFVAAVTFLPNCCLATIV
jgi:hypothetical protein